MAYVDRSSDGFTDDSAQVIVLAGFLVAIGIVVLAVFLNSLIFAQDLSTRDDGLNDRQITGFEQSTERMATDVASSVGHNSSGNITQDDLFGANDDVGDDVEDNFVESMRSYDENSTLHLDSRQAAAEIPDSDVNVNQVVWSVGQEFGEFQNESGESEFRLLDIDEDDDPQISSFELYIEDPFNDLASLTGEETFRVSVLNDRLPPEAQASQPGTAWEISFQADPFSGDTGINVTQNETGGGSASNFIDLDPLTDNLTIEMSPQEGEACIRVDAGECEDESRLEPDWLVDDQIESINIADSDDGLLGISNKNGNYEIRFGVDDVGGEDIVLCENNAPCVKETDDDFLVYSVGVVDDADFRFRYFDSDAEYTRSFEGITAERDKMPLEVVEE